MCQTSRFLVAQPLEVGESLDPHLRSEGAERRLPLAGHRPQVGVEGHHLGHSAVVPERRQRLVGQVARVVVDPAHAGVGGDHRRPGRLYRVQCRGHGSVGDVHHDAQVVGAPDRGASEIGEAAVLAGRVLEARVGHRRVAEVVVAVVGQPQVARAKVVVGVQDPQVTPQRMAVLDADERRQPPLAVNAANVCGRPRQHDGLRILHVRHPPDGGKLGEGVRHGAGVPGRVALALPHVDDEEDRIQPPVLHPHQVDLPASPLGLPGIVALGTKIGRNVHVRVHGEDSGVDGRGTGQKFGVTVCRYRFHIASPNLRVHPGVGRRATRPRSRRCRLLCGRKNGTER